MIKDCTAEDLQQIRQWNKARRTLLWKGVCLPKGHKVLRDEKMGSSGLALIELGVPWEPFEFVQQTAELRHPFDKPVVVPPVVAEAIWRCATVGPTRLNAEREATTAYYKQRSEDL